MFGVWGLGFEVWGLWFGVLGLRLWVVGFGFWVLGSGFGVWSLWFGFWGLGCGVWGSGFKVRAEEFRFGVWSLEYRAASRSARLNHKTFNVRGVGCVRRVECVEETPNLSFLTPEREAHDWVVRIPGRMPGACVLHVPVFPCRGQSL